jgi:hypothetical protein
MTFLLQFNSTQSQTSFNVEGQTVRILALTRVSMIFPGFELHNISTR